MAGELIALIPDGRAAPLLHGAKRLSAGGWQAILAPRAPFAAFGRRGAARAARRRLECLEALLAAECVLPALPGTYLSDADVAPTLEIAAPELDSLAQRYGTGVQYQLTVRCNPSDALAHFSSRSGPLGRPTDEAALRTSLHSFARCALDGLVRDLVCLPVDGDCILNAVLLTARGSDLELDAALARIDSVWTDGLRLRVVGPTPPLSFCSLGLQDIAPARLEAAARLLGVAPNAEAATILRARKQALIRQVSAPDEVREAATLLVKACRHPAAGRGFRDMFAWQEGRSVPAGALKGAA